MTPPQAYDDVDAEVAREVQHAWTEFARIGTPHSLDGTPWPQYDADTRTIAWIGNTTEANPSELTPVEDLIRASRPSNTNQ